MNYFHNRTTFNERTYLSNRTYIGTVLNQSNIFQVGGDSIFKGDVTVWNSSNAAVFVQTSTSTRSNVGFIGSTLRSIDVVGNQLVGSDLIISGGYPTGDAVGGPIRLRTTRTGSGRVASTSYGGIDTVVINGDGTVQIVELATGGADQMVTIDSTGILKRQAIPSGGGGGATTLNDLTDATISSVANNQLLKYNSSSSQWENWTPNFLTSYTETDPVFSAHAASGVTSTKISNWDTAFGWGNHASAGYLTSYTETDPIFVAHAAHNVTNTKITNWDTAYGWGNHASAGYITSLVHNHGVADSANNLQFTFGLNENIRFQGGGDTTVTFDTSTKKVIITSTNSYVVAEPSKQIVYGTGSGVDSSTNLEWDGVANKMNINGEIEILDSTRGIILLSPSGNRVRITVADDDSLITTRL
jgi:hypothetical protein